MPVDHVIYFSGLNKIGQIKVLPLCAENPGRVIMTPLPKSEWEVKRCGPEHAIVAMHTNGGGLYWTKFSLVDLPNQFIDVEDLKRIGIFPDYIIKQALDPQWEKTGKVHDWRNYISEYVIAMWRTFTDEQKIALCEQADEQASREHWN